MKIQNAQIDLKQQHQFSTLNSKQEKMRVWVDSKPPKAAHDTVTLSDAAKKAQECCCDENKDKDALPMDDIKAQLVKLMIKFLTGFEIKLFKASDLNGKSATVQPVDTKASNTLEAPSKAGFGIEYDESEITIESETSSFQASGVIQTQDGQKIDFSASLNLSRSFMSEKNISLRAGDAVKIDPLVLNFNGNAAEVTQTKFSFDLNVDGKEEQIATLKPGSGFLALDKNQDGKINDGSELFGPKSGNGFADLAQYDDDKNNFIDENDAVFNKLSVLSVNEDGSQSLLSLKQADVGAIYLGNVASPFSQKDSANNDLAQTTATGLFFKENGSVGTVQQIDYLA